MDVAKISELVSGACDEVLTSLDDVLSIDWSDLGEVTLVVLGGAGTQTFRLYVRDITDGEV